MLRKVSGNTLRRFLWRQRQVTFSKWLHSTPAAGSVSDNGSTTEHSLLLKEARTDKCQSFCSFSLEGYPTPTFIQFAVLREQKLATTHSEFAKQCLTEIRGEVNHSWTSLVSLQPHSTQAGYVQLRSIPSQHALHCANPTSSQPAMSFLLTKFSNFLFISWQLMPNWSFLLKFPEARISQERKKPKKL